MLKKACAIVGASVLVMAPAQSQEIAVLGSPTVDYEGERTIATSDVTLVQDFYSTSGKTRTETVMQGQETIQIWDQDQQRIIMLIPSQRMATEIDFATATQQSPISDLDEGTVILERRSEGTEQVNGIQAEKTYISARMSTGETMSGWVWGTPQNIVVRMRLTMTQADGRTQTMNYDLRDLAIGPQPDALFEVPAGYQLVSMGNPGMSAMGGYMGSLAEDAKNTAANETDRQVRNTVREETSKAIGRLFGR